MGILLVFPISSESFAHTETTHYEFFTGPIASRQGRIWGECEFFTIFYFKVLKYRREGILTLNLLPMRMLFRLQKLQSTF